MSGTGRRPRVNPMIAGFVAGMLIAGVVGLMAAINIQYGAPWASTHTLTVQVSDADSMSVGSDVRIAGRLVGQVVGIAAAGNHTNITVHVDSSDWPLPADTTADVRLATLLGQKYIQLNPGHDSRELQDNATIGLQSTRPVVDFDQILDTFNKPTRDALTSLIRTAAGAVQNREGTLQQLLPDLGDLSVHSQAPTQELVTRNAEFNNILVNLGVTAAQLSASRDDLASVIDNLNTVTAALASNEGSALRGYITHGDTLNQTTDSVLHGGAATQLSNGLQQLGTFATSLNGMLEHLIPQTQTFSQPDPLAEPSDRINSGGIPAKASIDLIYEIGSATSQGYGNTNFGTRSSPDYQGNFFLRQNAAGVDPCGLISTVQTTNVCGQPTGPSASQQKTAPPIPVQIRPPHLPGCIPGVTCNPLPCIPLPGLPCVTLPTPPPTPCIPVPGHACPTPALPCVTPPPLPTLLPTPTVTPCPSPTSGGILPTPPIPTPSLPLGLGQTASDQVTAAPQGWSALFLVRDR